MATTVTVAKQAKPKGAPNVSGPAGQPVEEAPPANPLAALKQRHAKIKEGLFKDFKVQRWDELETEGPHIEVWVRYKPVDTTRWQRSLRERAEVGGDDWEILANADLLTQNCLGVYGTIGDDHDTKYGLTPDYPTDPARWPTFGPQVAEVLGLDPSDSTSAGDICRAVYFTDGDLNATTARLVDWSGQAVEEAEKTFTKP